MQDKELIEALRELNPYPSDVFTEPTAEEWQNAGKILQANGIIPDRIFAKWGRMVWNNCTDELQELIEENQPTVKEQQLQRQIDELRNWKAEAMVVMSDIPAIGKAIGVPLGQSIHDKILPAIQQREEELKMLRERVAGQAFFKFTQQSELLEEMAEVLKEYMNRDGYTPHGFKAHDLLTKYNKLPKQ